MPVSYVIIQMSISPLHPMYKCSDIFFDGHNFEDKHAYKADEFEVTEYGSIPVVSLIHALGIDIRTLESNEVRRSASDGCRRLHHLWTNLLIHLQGSITPPVKAVNSPIDDVDLLSALPKLLLIDDDTVARFRALRSIESSKYKNNVFKGSEPGKGFFKKQSDTHEIPPDSKWRSARHNPSWPGGLVIPIESPPVQEELPPVVKPQITRGPPPGFPCLGSNAPPPEARKTSDTEETVVDPEYLSAIIVKRLESDSSQRLEGRAVQAFANHLIHAESELVAKKSLALTNQVIRQIVRLSVSGACRLSADKTRFGMQIPFTLEVSLLPTVLTCDLLDLWAQMGNQLGGITKFTPCVNAIVNSFSKWKENPQRDQLATSAVVAMIHSRWL